MLQDMEVPDREDLLNWDMRDIRGHRRKLKKDSLRRNLKNSFPHRVVDALNSLDKAIVCAETIHKFKT